MEENEAQSSEVWPELEALAQPARERRRLPPDTRSSIILRLCERAPLSVKDLSVLLDRSEAYIGDAIRPLVTAGELTFLYPDQPRHPRQKYIARGADAKPTPAGSEHPAADQHEQPASSAREKPVSSVPEKATSSGPEKPASDRLEPTPDRHEPAHEQAAAPQSGPIVAVRRPRLAYQLINTLVVVAVGIVLARMQVAQWPVYASAAAVLLALGHLVTKSPQLRQFRALHGARNRSLTFFVLKAGVAMLEIVIVYFITNAISRPV